MVQIIGVAKNYHYHPKRFHLQIMRSKVHVVYPSKSFRESKVCILDHTSALARLNFLTLERSYKLIDLALLLPSVQNLNHSFLQLNWGHVRTQGPKMKLKPDDLRSKAKFSYLGPSS